MLTKSIVKYKKILLVSVLVIIASIVRYKIIVFGLPYSFHADETYVYKDPLKLLLLYRDLNFSQPFNLVDWLLGIWTGVIFFAGKILGQWQDFNSFKELLLQEDGKIIFSYRLLSLLASVVGNLILFRLCTKISTNNLLRVIFALTFLFNPIELLSNNWIKYDPYVFLSFCILLNYSYSYFFLLQKDSLKKIYIFSIVAISVRIDFVAFFFSFFIYDNYINYSRLNSIEFLDSIKKNSISVLTGIFWYSFITLLPVTYFYNYFFPVATSIGITKPFEQVILSRIMTYLNYDTLFINITNNFLFYFNVCFLSLGPLIIFYISLFFFIEKRAKYLLLFIIFFSAVLLLYGAHGTHYFLSLSVIFIFGSCVFISQLKNPRLQIISAVVNLIYVSTMSISFLYAVIFFKDPRLVSADYITANIYPSDLIAMDTHSMNGLCPPINECNDVLLKKSEIIAHLGNGTGETYRMKATISSGNCWQILDIFSTDYFAGSAYENVWINTYDKDMLAIRNPAYYITTRSLQPGSDGGMLVGGSPRLEFYDYVNNNYTLMKEFMCDVPDPRLPYLLQAGLYFRPVRIYKKNKNDK